MPASPAVYIVAIGPTYSKVGFTSVQMTETLAESFYYVRVVQLGTELLYTTSSQKFSVMKTKKLVFPEK